jgi:hypothetical protein
MLGSVVGQGKVALLRAKKIATRYVELRETVELPLGAGEDLEIVDTSQPNFRHSTTGGLRDES